MPHSRWAVDTLYAPEPAPARAYARCAAFVAGVDRFDASCFGMPAAEALATDPQQRVLLEEALAAVAAIPNGAAGWSGSLAGKAQGPGSAEVRILDDGVGCLSQDLPVG